jgi:hypothetical protein
LARLPKQTKKNKKRERETFVHVFWGRLFATVTSKWFRSCVVLATRKRAFSHFRGDTRQESKKKEIEVNEEKAEARKTLAFGAFTPRRKTRRKVVFTQTKKKHAHKEKASCVRRIVRTISFCDLRSHVWKSLEGV